MTTQPDSPRRTIRSFVRREGRMTDAQRRALDTLLPRFGLDDTPGVWDLDACFGRQVPRYLELGFGSGTALLQMAANRPGHDFVGVEVHRPGVGTVLQHVHAQGLDNVRVSTRDGVEVLREHIGDGSLDGVYLFFPDPWHKKRHHKRRIVQPEFVALVAAKLKPGGIFHLATDWEDYAAHMLTTLGSCPHLRNTAPAGAYSERGERPVTKYERRGLRLGHGVWDLVFRRDVGPAA